MLSENSVDWKPCWWKNNGDDNSLRVKTVEMLNMLRVKSNRLVDRKPMWCKTVEILWQCWLNPTPPNSTHAKLDMKFRLRDISYPHFHTRQFHTQFFITYPKLHLYLFLVVLGTTNTYSSTSRHSNFASLFMTTGISRLFPDLFKSKSSSHPKCNFWVSQGKGQLS